MRARNIKPGLWKNETLAELPIEARYLFPGLWCLADCEGRLEDRPRRIKAEIYPYDDKIGVGKVHELLELLARSGFILRYQVCNVRYIQIDNWHKHQNPHKRERETGSEIPEPGQTLPGLVPEKPGLVPEIPEPVPVWDGTGPADSGFLIPDSGFPHTGFQRGRENGGPRLAPPDPVAAKACEWLDPWPRVADADSAIRNYLSRVTPETIQESFACRDRYLASDEVSRGIVMEPWKFIVQQADNKWRGKWPKPREDPSKSDAALRIVEQRLREREAR